MMTAKEKLTELREYVAELLAPPPEEKPSEWCERELILPPPQTETPGPFRLTGREYLREPLDDWGNRSVRTEVLCFGSQTGKTTLLMAGLAWSIANDPCQALWVMPSTMLARSFSETRWLPILRATPCLARLLPRGRDRHALKKLEQILGAAIVTFVGSNSPANLASRPVRRVILDEVDKLDRGTRGEADAVELAMQRTKATAYPQHWLTSTPTTESGPIWRWYLGGDQRRYFVPCPYCGEFVVFAWSREWTVLPLTGREAWICWDKGAKRKDGTWDLDRVKETAHALCPYCKGQIREHHKPRMIRNGEWRPTASGPYVSRHLSSLYACTPQTSWGALAVKFLQALRELGSTAIQGFVNGDLAEPYRGQDTQPERVELIVRSSEPLPDGGVNLMTVDVQALTPRFWWVVRRWWAEVETLPGPPKVQKVKKGNSRLIAYGTANSWEQLRVIQLKHQVQDRHVLIDSGYSATEVYEACLRFGKLVRRLWIGWMPTKGFAREQLWVQKGTPSPIHISWAALPPGTKIRLPLLHYADWALKDILQELRAGKLDLRWEVPDTVRQDYWTHLDAEVKKDVGGKFVWCKRAKDLPNHLLDCEVLQVAGALLHRLLALTQSNDQSNSK